MNTAYLTEKFIAERRLALPEYEILIRDHTPADAARLAREAVRVRKAVYGNAVYIRGLIEISSYCRNDCYYCGIRRGNHAAQRYRLTPDEILACAEEGYPLGFRTFVMQGGEDAYYTDEILCGLISRIKERHPDCAVTLSLGERSRESYERLRRAGADRYLLRHETADEAHYGLLHPKEQSFAARMQCLRDLRDLGYQVGCGFMVGSPFQKAGHLAKDLAFIESFRPEMCGIGPFIPHHDTPFRSFAAGSAEMTCFLLSVIRILHPAVLLPATTALGTIDPEGREKGILSGANVVMPNLTPACVRKNYMLYDNKLNTGAESAAHVADLAARMRAIGYEITADRGDYRQKTAGCPA